MIDKQRFSKLAVVRRCGGVCANIVVRASGSQCRHVSRYLENEVL